MAMKSKMDLKQIFNDPKALLYQKAVADLSGSTIALAPEYDLPVTVDTLQISMDDPTINHYKIIGMTGDWTSSASIGDMQIQFTVPTNNPDVIKLAFGENAVNSSLSATLDGGSYTGHAVKFEKHKVTGTFILVASDDKNLMILSNIALWAKPLYENPSTDPFAVQFTGTIEGADQYTMAWLTKKAAGDPGGK